MNVLFLTITHHSGHRTIYADLMREIQANGHQVYIVCPSIEKMNERSLLRVEEGFNVLRVKTGNVLGNISVIEKGIKTILLESLYINAIKRCFSNIHFELVIYSTPPITLIKSIEYIKKRDRAVSYLMLKDIFPQNAIDLGILTNKGLGKVIYNYFRQKERKLYKVSDFIGCMSANNIQYLTRHNPSVSAKKLGLCVNSMYPSKIEETDKSQLRLKYRLPKDKILFFYGGNFGKPQGISFLVKLLEENRNQEDRYFVLCGNGSDIGLLKEFLDEKQPNNVKLIQGLPYEEYDTLISACDVGMILLDNRFTISNYPSRILPLMEFHLPIFAATDINTDLRDAIIDGQFGWWCESKDLENCVAVINEICSDTERIKAKGNNAFQYLNDHFTVSITYNSIINAISPLLSRKKLLNEHSN